MTEFSQLWYIGDITAAGADSLAGEIKKRAGQHLIIANTGNTEILAKLAPTQIAVLHATKCKMGHILHLFGFGWYTVGNLDVYVGNPNKNIPVLHHSPTYYDGRGPLRR